MRARRPAGPDAFEVHLGEIRGVPVLSREAERDLARAYRVDGDTRAAHRLVTANLRFVVHVARRYRSYGLPLADLVQEGNLGLIRALEGFDPERGIRLISYAVWWIKACIHNYILRSWSMVRLGTTQAQRRLFFALARTQREVARRGDPAAPGLDDEALASVARKLRVTPAQVEEMGHRLSAPDVSLDAPAGEGPATRLDLIASDAPGQEELLSGAEDAAFLTAQVGAALAALGERERAIIEMRVMNDAPWTLQALGDSLGCTRERARQLEFRAKAKLRRSLGIALPGYRTGLLPRRSCRRGTPHGVPAGESRSRRP